MSPNEEDSSVFARMPEGAVAHQAGVSRDIVAAKWRGTAGENETLPQRRLQVLMLEDQQSDADLILREMQRAGFEFDWVRVETEEAFVARLDPALDLILADFRLPGGFDGLHALRLVQERALDIPFIIISAAVGDELGAECIKQGASDYVLKDRFIRAHLGRSVNRALEEKRLRDERQRVEETNRRLAAVVEASDDAIIGETLEGTITSWNRGAEEVFGYSAQEAIGKPTVMLIPPDRANEGSESLGRTAKGDRIRYLDTVRVRKDGVRVPVSLTISPIKDGKGQVTGASHIARNISESKRAAEELRESESRFRQLAENIRAVFWMTDARNQEIVYVSPAYESIWGQPCASLYANPRAWLDAVHPDERERIREAALKKRPLGEYDETYRVTRPDGSQRWIRDRSFPVQNEAGEIYRFVGIAEDITEQRNLEEQLRQSQKMEAVGHLAGGIAHDFSNILTVINAYTGILLNQQGIDADTREQLSQMARVAERASSLPRQLLTFSRKQVMRPATLDLNQIVTGTAKMLQRIIAEDVRLRLECSPVIPPVWADAGMLEQVLMNLAVNARDAMPRGGQLVISTDKTSVDDAYLATHPQARLGEFVTMQVSDTGCGMQPEVMAHIFEPFFTTKRPGEGTGLGLATVFSIAQQHRGWIVVESEVSRGTTIKMFIPRAETLLQVQENKSAGLETPGGTETILIVEDEARVRRLALKTLERQGYRVLSASSGIAALSLWNSQAEEIDLLITDMVMPYGMNGSELVGKLRVLKPDLKVIFMSGYAVDEVDAGVELVDGVNFLQKPYGPEKLAKIVRQCLDA